MKKCSKGFSIPELLAAIVIMGILVTIAIASYNGISKNMKQKTYENKLSLIKTKALEYAIDNEVDVATISVAKLVDEGYLEMENDTDANEKISNPLGGYFDCYKIDINRSLDDYDINVNDSNDCALADSDTLASNINIYAYEDDGNPLGDNNKLGVNKDIRWTNNNVYLYLDPASLGGLASQEMTITWSINGNNDIKSSNVINYPSTNSEYANIYKLETSYLLNTRVIVKVQTSSGLLSKSVNIKIDKEKPSLALDTNASYETSSKVITFNGSDGAGSGFSEFAYALTDNLDTTPEFSIKSSENHMEVYENKTYYGYAIDRVGNVSSPVEINVSNIDNSKPACKNPVDNPGWSTSYTYTYGCLNDSGSGCANPNITETQTDEARFKDINWTAKDNVGNSRECSATVAVNVDRTAPTCSITVDPSSKKGDNNWYIGDVKLNLTTSDNLSGVSEVGISTSTYTTFNGQKSATLNWDTNSSGVTYYGYVKDKAGNVGKCSINVRRLTSHPTCSISITSGTKGTNNWYVSDINASISSPSAYVKSKTINGQANSYTVNWNTAGQALNGTVTNEAGLTGNCSGGTVKREVGGLDYKTTAKSGSTYGCGFLSLGKCTWTTFGMEILQTPVSGIASKSQSWDGNNYNLGDSVGFELGANSSATIFQRVCSNAGNCIYHQATASSNRCGAVENLGVKIASGLILAAGIGMLFGPVGAVVGGIIGLFMSCN